MMMMIMPKFSKGHNSRKIKWFFLKFNQVIYSSSPISWPIDDACGLTTTTNKQPTDKKDFTAKSENLQVVHILKLSIQSNSKKFQWFILKDKETTPF